MNPAGLSIRVLSWLFGFKKQLGIKELGFLRIMDIWERLPLGFICFFQRKHEGGVEVSSAAPSKMKASPWLNVS